MFLITDNKCSKLPNITNGHVFVKGHRGFYYCNKKFHLNGVQIRECHNEKWIGDEPKCQSGQMCVLL